MRAASFVRSAGLLLLCLAGAASVAAQTDDSSGSVRMAVEQIARRYGAEGGDEALVAQQLKSLGPAALPVLVDVATGRPPLLRAESGAPLLNPQLQSLILDVLGAWPPGQVVAEIVGDLDDEATLSDRTQALVLVGKVSDAHTLEALFEIASGMSVAERQHPVVERTLQTALVGVLSRDRRGYDALDAALTDVDPALRAVAARAIGDAGDGRGLFVLRASLDLSDRLDAVVLRSLGKIQLWDAECISGTTMYMLSKYLHADDPSTRRYAVAGLGRQGGSESIEALIDRLDDGDGRVRSVAQWSLERLTGQKWSSADEWNRFYAAEREWFVASSEELLEAALGDAPGPAFAALRELSVHRSFRRELARDLAPALAHDDESVAVAACQAVARLTGPTAFAALYAALDDDRAGVRRTAAQALGELRAAELRERAAF